MQKEDIRKELDIEIKKKKSLSISIKEGAYANMSGLGDSLITPLATEIGANSIHIGFLNALSGLASPLAMIHGDRLMEKHSRRTIVAKYVLYNALMWLPIAIIGFLFYKDILTIYLPWILIILYSALAYFGGLGHPAWFSWMGDLIEEKERGKYLSKRNAIIGTAGAIVVLIGGWALKYFRSMNYLFLGFSFLFILSFVFRLLSHACIKKQYEPKFRLEKRDYFSFWSFIKRYDSFGKFAVYQAFFNLAIMIASPFFAFYMLKNLGLETNYLLYMVITLASTGFYLIFTPLAGKFSDKYGNLKLMYIANSLFILNPLIWLFVKTPLTIILIPQLVSGLANATLTMAITGYTYDAVSQKNRGLCVTYTNVLIGLGVLVGSLLGGYLIATIHTTINSFFVVFIIAAIARFIVAIFFLPQLKEVKRVKQLSVSNLHLPIHFHLTNPLKYIHGLNPFISNKSEKSKLLSSI